ncbi:MAG: T9SS type A sorting domain-containing protein [Flavobacteriales bacterium]|jgi:hypothetical protein|nr:T9SS type A sorting domain-containing protein [Flavobacteriales bacterium]
MNDLLTMQQSKAGNWKELDQVDKNILYAHAAKGKTGAARAAAILLSLEEDSPLPPVRFPNTTKSRRIVQRNKIVALLDPTLACYPNPSNATSYLTYPAALDGSTMVIIDAKGSLVHTQTLRTSGLLELDTKEFPEGMYQIAIPGTAFSPKLSVQH